MDCVDDMEDLTSRVQDLPPELFSRIYEFVTAVEPNLIVEISSTYRPPPILQLDRTSREQVATQYYSRGTIFRFTTVKRQFVVKWLASVPPQSRLLIDRIEVGHGQERWIPDMAQYHAERMAGLAKKRGLVLGDRLFHASYDMAVGYIGSRHRPKVKKV
ncbi:hypothetical protein CBER1_07478 [Cercospora berteroae]|uniref:F-box domain-containing protein n=1 Tax=Cercospora berteroae TaxID=357750 RepID=A0A2S6BTG5_9PEZI|nr:hypothetical protein CBER1_07478 [Cercospora berteroae]